jgi:putative peptidoglycan lipid II flippase
VLGVGMWWAAAHIDWIGLRAQPFVRIGLLAACLGAAAVAYFGVLAVTGVKLRQMLRR